LYPDTQFPPLSMERVPVSTILRIVHYTPVRSGLVCAVGLNF